MLFKLVKPVPSVIVVDGMLSVNIEMTERDTDIPKQEEEGEVRLRQLTSRFYKHKLKNLAAVYFGFVFII